MARVRNSSMWRAQGTSSAAAAPAATFSSKLGSGESKPRANQKARKRNTRSVSLTWLSTWRMLHFPGA